MKRRGGKKIELLAKKQNTSATAMVRNAIDAYNPDIPTDMEGLVLLELVSERVKKAIADTSNTRRNLDNTLKNCPRELPKLTLGHSVRVIFKSNR